MKAKALIGLTLLLAALTGPAHGREQAYPWTAYFGAPDEPARWTGFVRGIGNRRTGMALRAVSVETPLETRDFRSLVDWARKLIQTHDLVLRVGGLRSAHFEKKVNEFMGLIEQDEAKSWKDLVHGQALALARLPNARERIYWQVGNEINNKGPSQWLRKWAKLPPKSGRDDKEIIPIYVEYYLAPTVEALRAASREAFGADDKIQILLGTIARGHDAAARDWLASLLQYEIRGRYAKSLAGTKVLDLVDLIGIHYIATRDDEGWLATWDELRDSWLGRGRIRGIWATEELDKRAAEAGLGGVTAVKVTFRYLHWWGRHAITPREGRCSLWGARIGQAGTTGDEAMRRLYDFLGDVPLTELAGAVTLKPGTDLETYAFEAPLGAKRVIAMISSRENRTLAIEPLVMGAHGWSGDVTASLHVFSAEGHAVVPMSAQRQDGGYTLSPQDQVRLRGPAAAVIFLEPQSPRK